MQGLFPAKGICSPDAGAAWPSPTLQCTPCPPVQARLRQPGFPLAAKEKDDIYMKVGLNGEG